MTALKEPAGVSVGWMEAQFGKALERPAQLRPGAGARTSEATRASEFDAAMAGRVIPAIPTARTPVAIRLIGGLDSTARRFRGMVHLREQWVQGNGQDSFTIPRHTTSVARPRPATRVRGPPAMAPGVRCERPADPHESGVAGAHSAPGL